MYRISRIARLGMVIPTMIQRSRNSSAVRLNPINVPNAMPAPIARMKPSTMRVIVAMKLERRTPSW
jgi:hypothetical protein